MGAFGFFSPPFCDFVTTISRLGEPRLPSLRCSSSAIIVLDRCLQPLGGRMAMCPLRCFISGGRLDQLSALGIGGCLGDVFQSAPRFFDLEHSPLRLKPDWLKGPNLALGTTWCDRNTRGERSDGSHFEHAGSERLTGWRERRSRSRATRCRRVARAARAARAQCSRALLCVAKRQQGEFAGLA